MWQPSTLIWCKKTVAIWWQTCIIFNHLVPFILSPLSFISHPISLWFISLLHTTQKSELSLLCFWSARNYIKVVEIAHQHYVATNHPIGFISAMCRSKKPLFLFFNQPFDAWDQRRDVCTHVCWQDSGSRGTTCWSQWYLSTSPCFLQGHRNHRRSAISSCVRQQPLSFWTAESQPGPPTDLWRMVGFFLLLHLATCPNGGEEGATGLLYYCTSSETRLTWNLRRCEIENQLRCLLLWK